MKKEDIIGQKLFETCKLSEFYLNLVVNSKYEDENPMQLAKAYTQKLHEIVERYDRLLEANKQREQLSLSFDTTPSLQQKYHSPAQQRISNQKLPTPTQNNSITLNTPLTRTSTPNKSFNILNNVVTPVGNVLTPATTLSSSSSFASTPTTPNQSIKSSFSNYSCNSYNRRSNSEKITYPGSSNSNSNSNSNLNNSNLSYSNRNYSFTHTPKSYHSNSHSHHYSHQHQNHSSSSNNANQIANKFYQRLTSIYYDDDYDIENEDMNVTNTNQTNQDDIEVEDLLNNQNGLNCIKLLNTKTNDILTTSASSNLSSSSTVSSSSVSPGSSNSSYSKNQHHHSDNYSDLDNNQHNTTISSSTSSSGYSDEHNDSNHTQIIEKSYSNLSKDSGVFAESYHSDYSNNSNFLLNNTVTNESDSANTSRNITVNCNKTIDMENEDDLNGDEEIQDEDEFNETLNSPLSNDTDENYHEIEKHRHLNKNSTTKEPNRLIWGSISRLVEGHTKNLNQNRVVTKPPLNFNSNDTNYNNLNNSLKYKLANTKTKSNNIEEENTNNNYKTYKKAASSVQNLLPNNSDSFKTIKLNSTNSSSTNEDIYEKKFNLNLELDDLQENSMLSMVLLDNNDNLVSVKERINSKANSSNIHEKNSTEYLSNSNLSCCSSVSTPSPSSTSSSSSSGSGNNSVDYEQSCMDLTKSTSLNNKVTPFLFNYNSLMNVSMLDSIQATNTSLEFDNMNSSILMFN